MTAPTLSELLTRLATPSLALIAVIIAYQQWRLANDKFKLDLFDKRYKVYYATRMLLFEITLSGSAKEESLLEFMRKTADVIFLFDVEVAKYLVEIRDMSVDLQIHNDELESAPAKLKPQLEKDKAARFEDLKTALKGLDAVFYPYLGFAKRSPLKFQAELRRQGR